MIHSYNVLSANNEGPTFLSFNRHTVEAFVDLRIIDHVETRVEAEGMVTTHWYMRTD